MKNEKSPPHIVDLMQNASHLENKRECRIKKIVKSTPSTLEEVASSLSATPPVLEERKPNSSQEENSGSQKTKMKKKNVIKTSDIYQKENLYKYCEEHCPYRAENIASLPFQIISPVVRVSVSGSAMKQREICREVVAQPPLPHATCQHHQPRRAVRLPQPVATYS